MYRTWFVGVLLMYFECRMHVYSASIYTWKKTLCEHSLRPSAHTIEDRYRFLKAGSEVAVYTHRYCILVKWLSMILKKVSTGWENLNSLVQPAPFQHHHCSVPAPPLLPELPTNNVHWFNGLQPITGLSGLCLHELHLTAEASDRLMNMTSSVRSSGSASMAAASHVNVFFPIFYPSWHEYLFSKSFTTPVRFWQIVSEQIGSCYLWSSKSNQTTHSLHYSHLLNLSIMGVSLFFCNCGKLLVKSATWQQRANKVLWVSMPYYYI